MVLVPKNTLVLLCASLIAGSVYSVGRYIYSFMSGKAISTMPTMDKLGLKLILLVLDIWWVFSIFTRMSSAV